MCHWTELKKLFCSRPKKSYQSLQHLHKDSNMTAFINQRLVVVQLVIKPWWRDWRSLMEFLIDILVDVDVGGWHLKVPTSSNVFPPFFLVVFTGPNKFIPWIIIICIKMHEKTHYWVISTFILFRYIMQSLSSTMAWNLNEEN